jgi:hypothetical protein
MKKRTLHLKKSSKRYCLKSKGENIMFMLNLQRIKEECLKSNIEECFKNKFVKGAISIFMNQSHQAHSVEKNISSLSLMTI